MSRISYRRATPENWERTIKRMVTLNHVVARAGGRARHPQVPRRSSGPGAGRGAADRVRRRAAHDRVHLRRRQGRVGHLLGLSLDRPRAQRAAHEEEWELLVAMHRGYYPLVDNQPMNGGQGFRRTRPMQTEPGPDGRPPDNRHPMDKVLEHLDEDVAADDAGVVGVVGGDAGAEARRPLGDRRLACRARAPIYGEMTVTADPARAGQLHHRDAATPSRAPARRVTRTGKALVYTGYPVARPRRRRRAADATWREVMFVERDWTQMCGTLVHRRLRRDRHRREADAAEQRSGRARHQRRGAEDRRGGQRGPDLRRQPSRRARARGHRPRPGRDGHARRQRTAGRDRGRGGRRGRRADRRARSCRSPASSSRRRWSSTTRSTASRCCRRPAWRASAASVFPKQLQQFEAVGVNNGPDGKPDTDDDLDLGLVDVKWTRRGIHRDVRRRRHAVRRHARRRTGCSRRTSTVRIRSAAATATTSATSGWSPSWRRRCRAGEPTAAGARAPAGHGAALHGAGSTARGGK